MKFTYGSVCSGIEAVSVAWGDFAKPLWFSEIEPFPCEVLAHHYPNVPNFGDMRNLPERIINREIPAPDVLVGGTPCQAFSVAGLRNSLGDERGNLTLTLIHILEAIDYVRYKDEKKPCVLLWENVPGALSTKDNAFGHFLAGLAQEREPLPPTGGKWSNAGYVHSSRAIAWRILDAQYFGLAQRRRRLFLVASAGDISPAKILFEQKSLRGDIKTSESERENITAFIETGFAQYRKSEIGGTVRASGGALSGGSETIVVVQQENIARKLTPMECERLQGFLDNYTRIPFRGKTAENCPDSHRYKAIGNSMAVPVMRWIGKRLFTTIS